MNKENTEKATRLKISEKKEIVKRRYSEWLRDMRRDYPTIRLKDFVPLIHGDESDLMKKKHKDLFNLFVKKGGSVSAACKAFEHKGKTGISSKTFYSWKKECLEFSEAVDNYRYGEDDDQVIAAEKTLKHHVNEKMSLTAAIYVLDNKGHDKGWGVKNKTALKGHTVHYILSFEK